METSADGRTAVRHQEPVRQARRLNYYTRKELIDREDVRGGGVRLTGNPVHRTQTRRADVQRILQQVNARQREGGS